jgi:CBS domain-containing protein
MSENVSAWQREHPWEPSPEARPEPVPLASPSDLVNPLLSAADVMVAEPRTCSPFSTALEAALIFRDADCGAVPVVEDGRPVGVLTDRDLALALPERGADLGGTAVGELMTRDVVTIATDAPLDVAIERLGERGLRRLLVVGPDGRLAGILSWTDLAPHVSERALGHVVARIAARR